MAAEESTIVEIQEHAHESLQQILDALPGEGKAFRKFTIYRVPANIRESRKIYFEPRILSIGPYHHGKPHLQGMERYKALYLSDFLSRSNIALESYLSVVKTQLQRARNCYFESIYQFSDEKFAEMLLLDGCFILEFLFKCYEPGETIFCAVNWMYPLIRCDLLMLENQIPFFVLQSLFDHHVASFNNNNENIDGTHKMPSLLKIMLVYHFWMRQKVEGTQRTARNELPSLVDLFVCYLMDGKVEGSGSVAHTDIYHLLHLYHHFYVSKPDVPVLDKKPRFLCLPKALKFVAAATKPLTYFSRKKKGSITERTPRAVPSATKLREIGVKFKKKDTSNLFDITFKNGILEIPFLEIENSTKPRIMNLVAFEQCIPGGKSFLTSYVEFMDHIIDTPKDISILRRSGVLEHLLTSDEDAASFFNQLADFTYLDYEKHYLARLYKDVNKYCSSSWHERRAKLMRNYFSSPWTILSLGAAVILLILTFLQTFFAVYSYYRPGS